MDEQPLLRIARFTVFRPSIKDNQEVYSSLSARQRICMPKAKLKDLNILITIFSKINYEAFNPRDFDMVIFDKPGQAESTVATFLNAAEKSKEIGSKVVLDVCNNFLDPIFYGVELATSNYAEQMLALIDGITVNDKSTQEYLRQYTNKPSWICGESYEYDEQPVKLKNFNHPPIRLLWFGVRVNVPQLILLAPSLKILAKDIPIKLAILTDISESIIEQLKPLVWANFSIDLIPWTLDLQKRIFADYDFVLLPEYRENSLRSGNKCVESLHAGCPVIASPLPAYQQFADYICITDDIAQGIRDCINNPQRVYEKTVAGQQYVKQHYNVEAIAKQWEVAFREIAAL